MLQILLVSDKMDSKEVLCELFEESIKIYFRNENELDI